jgi:hypothetical protein
MDAAELTVDRGAPALTCRSQERQGAGDTKEVSRTSAVEVTS